MALFLPEIVGWLSRYLFRKFVFFNALQLLILAPRVMSSTNSGDVRDLQRQLAEARTVNKRLEEDQFVLKTQYDEAMKLAQQVTDKHDENARLKRQINAIKAEKDEIERRLKIALQMNEELKERGGNGEHPVLHYASEVSALREQVACEKQRFAEQVERLNEQCQKAAREGERMKARAREMEDEVASLLEAAQAKYGSSFASVNELRQFLLAPEEKDEKKVDEKVIQELQDASELVVEKLQKRLKEEKKARRAAVARARQDEDEYNQRKAVLEKAVSDLESQVEEAQMTMRETELSHKQKLDESGLKIQHLEGSLEVLKSKNEQLKREKEHLEDIQKRPNPLAMDVAQLKDRVRIQDEQLKDSGAAVVLLKKQVKSLVSEIKTMERVKEKLEYAVKAAEQRAQEVSDELATTRTDKEKLEMENEELRESLENTKAQLSAAKIAADQSDAALKDLETHTNQVKEINAMLEGHVEHQKKEISKMYGERDRIINLIQKVWNFARVTEDNFEATRKANKKLRSEIKQMQLAKMEERQSVVNPPVEPIPYTSWISGEFPSELRDLVSDLARNDVLPVNAKLKHILGAIAKFYNEQINDKDKIAANKQQSIDLIVDQLDHFLISLGTILENEQPSAERFVTDPNIASQIINSIASLKDKLHKCMNDKRLEQFDSILLKLNVKSFDECMKELDQQNQQRSELTQALKSQVQKNRRQKKQFALVMKENEERQNVLKESLNEQKDVIYTLEAKVKEALKVTEQQCEMIDDLKNQIQIQHQESQDEKDEIKRSYEEAFQSMKENYETEKQQMTEQIEAQLEQISQYETTIKKQKKEIEQLKKTLELTRQIKLEKEEEVKSLVAHIEEMKALHADRLAEAKESVKSQYEELVARLKDRINELRKLATETSDALAACEAKNKDLMKQIRRNEKEIESAKQKLVLKDEELNRERQLIESRCQASTIQTEMKCQSIIEEANRKHEEETTKLCSYVIKHFKELFDGRQFVDVSCMKQVVELASTEYHRLLASDESIRRLLGLAVSESTEDAVSKLLLSF